MDMPRASIPVGDCNKNIIHIVLSHIHVLIYWAGLQKRRPFQSQTTGSYQGLWASFPAAVSALKQNQPGVYKGNLAR